MNSASGVDSDTMEKGKDGGEAKTRNLEPM
jgi:hypothetical protein